MSPPAKKRKRRVTTTKEKPQKKLRPTPQSSPILSEKPTPPPPTQSSLILSLPDDLLLNCIARVSRLYYPTLSLVSKSFRSLIASPELYKVRSLLGRTESCLYVCFWCWGKFRWFTLCRKPDKTQQDTSEKKNKSSGYVLATASIPHSRYAHFWSIVAVGSNIYNIDPSSTIYNGPARVSILDCRSHTWRLSCSIFRMIPPFFSASALDGKIYVAGICREDGSYKNFIKVFDTKTQTCDPEPIPFDEEYGKVDNRSVCIDGKFHVVLRDTRVLAYNSDQSRWDLINNPRMAKFMDSDSYCEIDSVLYSADQGAIRWFDTEESMWREVEGLVGLPELPPNGTRVRLADYGGNMAVLWENKSPHSHAMVVWCAEIVLERPQPSQIWGKVEWFDHVLTSYHEDIVKVVSATL